MGSVSIIDSKAVAEAGSMLLSISEMSVGFVDEVDADDKLQTVMRA